MKKAPHPFALVVWDDAHADMDQFKPTEWQKHRAEVIYTQGYVLQSDDKGISIAWEWLPPGDDYRSITFVPRSLVREEIYLTMAKKNGSRIQRRLPPPNPGGTSTDSAGRSREGEVQETDTSRNKTMGGSTET